jgi:hypothetical protein
MSMADTSFVKKYILKINRDEVVFDLFLVFYSEFFLYRLVTGGKWFVEILSLESLLLVGVFIDFFILWYIGQVLKE